MSATAQSTPHTCDGCLDRREVLVRAGLVTMGVAAAGVLAACGGSDTPTDAAPAASDGTLAQLSDIPVGGAISAQLSDGQPIILVQPEKGTVVALTAVCTHQQCTVAPDGAELKCPCHGSVYDLTGANVSGPAPSPLAQFDVHISNGAVVNGKA
ncbi:(2Fe-2S)-binding protein [Cellulomonas sp. Root485]|uniref:QcrA and Rieske domain-containing protein n=1 Tax=Cellulomonas sp. Root485 TaxID=1736546 RepID=UPI0006FE348E|nr:Rieske (2Fe-2S) protein [Cellulomonas sp. Root485]KQY22156.1 (2Fe-2S)-binding protein [Cellulomonas sp. Root485]